MIGFRDASGTAPDADSSASGTHAVREGILTIPGTLTLHFGGSLDNVHVAWRIVGTTGPVVVALGGISAGRYVSGDQPKGWWSDLVGPGGSLDTDRFQVLGFDFLGGSGETTGPHVGESGFPAISAFDQGAVLKHVLEHLHIRKVEAIIGASYGAMVALAFAERWPDLVGHVIAISGADRSHPMSTAWRSVQRAMVRYAIAKGDGPEGLRLARALAMATYRSADEFAARFSGTPTQADGRFQFPVENYLLSRGDAYAASYVPEAFVCLSESIDLHQVDASRIRTPVTLVAVREDQLVPLGDMQSLKSRLAGPATLVELSSTYGHDAFLKEVAALRRVFGEVLNRGNAE